MLLPQIVNAVSVRVGLSDGPDGRLLGHITDAIAREVIAHDDGRPLFRLSTDSPLRTTEGALEQIALFASQSAGAIDRVMSAAERIDSIVINAHATMARIRRVGVEPC